VLVVIVIVFIVMLMLVLVLVAAVVVVVSGCCADVERIATGWRAGGHNGPRRDRDRVRTGG